MNKKNKQKTYKKPAIRIYAIVPNRFLANSDVSMHSNAFDNVKQGTEYDEGR